MTKPIPQQWRPIAIADLRSELSGFEDWVLCGGHSVALATGSDTRDHGDIDIGVFRSRLSDCLRVFGLGRVHLCRDGSHVAWDGGDISEEIHDVWISDRDGTHWALQVMVFDDDGDEVIYRRDRRLRWSKKSHSLTIDGLRVLNPLVTFLFKAHQPALAEKEIHDLMKLIENWPNPPAESTGTHK